jgi:hypothetical protein
LLSTSQATCRHQLRLGCMVHLFASCMCSCIKCMHASQEEPMLLPGVSWADHASSLVKQHISFLLDCAVAGTCLLLLPSLKGTPHEQSLLRGSSWQCDYMTAKSVPCARLPLHLSAGGMLSQGNCRALSP